MADAESRVLGSGEFITVPDADGKDREYLMSPVNLGHLGEVQREAVRSYKKGYIQTYADSVDLIPDGQKVLLEKIEEAARMDVRDLPKKYAYDVSEVPLTNHLIAEIEAIYGPPVLPKKKDEAREDEPTEEQKIEAIRKALLVTALDAEKLTPEAVEDLSGVRPSRGLIPYDAWWVTANHDGMIMLVWASVKQSNHKVTREEVASWPMPKLALAARTIERLTAPAIKNM
jgi:hypothetical protein